MGSSIGKIPFSFHVCNSAVIVKKISSSSSTFDIMSIRRIRVSVVQMTSRRRFRSKNHIKCVKGRWKKQRQHYREKKEELL